MSANKPLRIAFDVGGVLSKQPDIWRAFINAVDPNQIEVHIISDMHPVEMIIDTLNKNSFDKISRCNIHSADYDHYGEMCKAVLCERLGIDILIDDFIGYVAVPGATVRLLVMPDSDAPYYHDAWKTDGTEGSFGRRTASTGRRGDGGNRRSKYDRTCETVDPHLRRIAALESDLVSARAEIERLKDLVEAKDMHVYMLDLVSSAEAELARLRELEAAVLDLDAAIESEVCDWVPNPRLRKAIAACRATRKGGEG
jgi:hypothetical protein